MKFGFVDEHRQVWPVRVMCAVLGLSASGYYAWRGRPESPRSVANRELTEDIRLIHAESSGCYGSPRIHATLRRHGRRIGRSRVERLMRRAGLRGLAALPRRARTTNSRHGYPIAPNRLARNFEAAAPNQVWLADLDPCSHRPSAFRVISGWSVNMPSTPAADRARTKVAASPRRPS